LNDLLFENIHKKKLFLISILNGKETKDFKLLIKNILTWVYCGKKCGKNVLTCVYKKNL